MSAPDGTPAGQPEPDDADPDQSGPPDPFGFDYAEDGEWLGDVDAGELTPEEDAYRARAYETVAHLAGEYQIPCFPIWWAKADGSCACPDGFGCDSPGKHPHDIGWPDMATDDAEQASRWWRPLDEGEDRVDWRPRSNIGILMGVRHFLVDVDMGPDQQGDASLTALIAVHKQDMPHTLLTQTGGGGRQHVMLLPEGVEVRNSVSELGDNLDIRGARGYGIAPPSRSGKGPYTMIVDAPPAEPPEWLAEWLRKEQRKRKERIAALPKGASGRPLPKNLSVRARRYTDAALRDAVKKVSEAPDHQRNVTLNAQAFDMFAKYAVIGLLDPGDVMAALKDAAGACNLPVAETMRTLRSAWDGAQAKDRSGELPDWIFQTSVPARPRPDLLTDPVESWLARDPETAVTGLDPDGRVQLSGEVKKDNSSDDILLSWAVALGYASPHIAVHGGQLVVVSGAAGGSLHIGELDARRLRRLCANGLTYTHHVEKTTEKDESGNEVEVVEEWDERIVPTLQMCGTVVSDPAIQLYRPELTGITKVPVLRPEPDVSLLERQGVDPSTRRVYWPDLPIGLIPARPSRSEVAAARKLLLNELMHDFPWSSPADKANCLAMWLTSYLQAYAGFLSPLFVVNASKSSSGKGFLVTVMVETTGAYFRSWVNQEEEEIRKALTACLMESDPVIIFDDVGKKDTISSATLASVLTKHQWDDRLLGVSRNFRGENNRTWVANGNNVKLGGDIPSRSVRVHLDPGPGDPKDRDVTKFVLGDISVWLTQEENKVAIIPSR